MFRTLGRFLVAVAVMSAPLATTAQGTCKAITTRRLALDSRNDEWTSANLRVNPGDIVLLFAKGTVKVGNFTGRVDASGSKPEGWGKVQMKVGTGEVLTTGPQWMRIMDQEGSVKFRVSDRDYRDNEGAFDLTVVVIPQAVIPEPQVVQAD